MLNYSPPVVLVGNVGLREAEQAFQLELDTLESIMLLRRGDPDALSQLTGLAAGGGSIANFYLALAYEQGRLVSQDLPKVRNIVRLQTIYRV